MSAYYVNIGGQSYGPAELEELGRWHKAGSLGPDDFVWDEASGAWVEAARFPQTASIFIPAPPPTLGISEPEELTVPTGDAGGASPAQTAEDHCANHSTRKAVIICSRCQKSYCPDCIIHAASGDVCINCVGDEKGRATKGRGRAVMIAIAILSIPAILISSYTIFGSKPAPQPETLPKITLERGEPKIIPEHMDAEPSDTQETAPID